MPQPLAKQGIAHSECVVRVKGYNGGVALLHELDPGPGCPGVVRMIVEIPKNSSNKYEYDCKLGIFRLDRALYSPMHYPGEYGFVPGTLAEDGDPLDILTLVDDPSYPGIMQGVRPVGVLVMMDQGTPDEKILAVPERNPRFDQIRAIADVPPHVRREIEHFFRIYKDLEGKRTEVREWADVARAHELILQSRRAFLESRL